MSVSYLRSLIPWRRGRPGTGAASWCGPGTCPCRTWGSRTPAPSRPCCRWRRRVPGKDTWPARPPYGTWCRGGRRRQWCCRDSPSNQSFPRNSLKVEKRHKKYCYEEELNKTEKVLIFLLSIYLRENLHLLENTNAKFLENCRKK